MHTLADDYDLVLEMDGGASLEVAKQYLEDAGIPALIEQGLSSFAYLGYSPPAQQGRLYVPKGLRARAEEVLVDLRGQGDTLDKLVRAGSVPGEELAEAPRRRPVEFVALILVITLAVVALLGWMLLRR